MFEPLHGLNSASITPFDAQGNIDTTAFARLLESQMEIGVTGFFVCGSTGEGVYLTDDERKTMAEVAVNTVAGQAAVMIHVGAMSTEQAVGLARHAGQIGADAVSTIAPVYYSVGFEATLSHYKTIGAATDLPFFIYHIPHLTGAALTADSAVRLTEIPNLAGLKFTDPALYLMRWIFELTGEKLTMLSGPDELHLPALTMGAHGAIGSTYNMIPGAYLRLRQAFFAGDIATAMDLQARCNKMIYHWLQFGGLGAFKSTMKLLGHEVGAPRAPIAGLSAEQEQALFAALRADGFDELAAMRPE